MRIWPRAFIAIVFISLSAALPVALAQDAEWNRLNQEASSHFSQGNYGHAESTLRKALKVAEESFGLGHPIFAKSLNNLAVLYVKGGDYAQAALLLKRALVVNERVLGSNHPDVLMGLTVLAELYRSLAQYEQAEPLLKRSLEMNENTLGAGHPDVATGLNSLAEMYRSQSQYSKAEPLYKRSLKIREEALGPEHPDVATSLNNLAELYRTQARYIQAEPLYKRSMAIYERALGPEHQSIATTLNNLALLYYEQGEYEQAESHYKRSLAIVEKTLGLDHSDVARGLNNLAALYTKRGEYVQAIPLFNRALVINEKAFGPEHPYLAISMNNVARLYSDQGQYAQAEPLYKRSLTIWRKVLGSEHPSVALSLNNLAELYYKQGLYSPALHFARSATAIYRQRIVAGGTGDSAVQEAGQNRFGFANHLLLLARNFDREASDTITDEAIQIVQLEQASGTASAVARMAARFATGNEALATLIKRKQEANDRRAKREVQLVTASSKLPQERKTGDEEKWSSDIASAGKEIEAVDQELTRRFPEYQELTRPEPLSVGQIRALLKTDEAMLVYALGNKGFLWVVRPNGAVFIALDVDVKALANNVATIRSEMEFDYGGDAKRVSVGLLHELYQTLFAPAVAHLGGAKHVMVVPSGSLQSLPFSMLIASPPPEIQGDAGYQKADWVAKHYALSILPSVSSIQAFRQFAKPVGSQEPFAGFGDPLIGEKGSNTRGNRVVMDIAAVFRNTVARNKVQASVQENEVADIETIRRAPRLPETAHELREMGKLLKAGPNSIWLQGRATETAVKRLDLSKYRTLAFATHGVMAGEIKGIGEPGLVLTPPKQGSTDDDGYLSASEIARLKLNADWVILSACNTAAADGTPGAEGLSGLAKAFFYAGARSLLVSHWPVASEATVPLTTTMLREYEASPGQGKAEAHRKSMIALMNTPNHPEYAHPIFWAPFVVVGEGGAGTRSKTESTDKAR